MIPFEQFFNSFSPEDLHRHNQKQLEESEKDYKIFKSAFERGLCCYCQGTLNTINEKKDSCYHWLIVPKGLKKKNIEKFFEHHTGYLELLTYLRWVANTEAPFKAINNLSEDKNPSKLIEETINYKNIEWAFSCGRTDFEGHNDSKNAAFPHYHFSMIVDNRPLLSFNDLHIPLSPKDIYLLDAKDRHPEKIDTTSYFAQGMEEVLTEVPPKELLDAMTNNDDFENSTFRVQTMILPEPGKTISGNDLIRMMIQSKETGIPVSKIAQDSGNYIAKTFISPGDGVPEMRKRNPRKKKK